MFANSLGFTAGTAKAAQATRALRGELLGLKPVAASLTTVLGGLGIALGGVAIIRGMKSMLSESMESIDAMGDLSDRLGVATERLTGLGHAAQMNGSSAEELNSSLDRMSKRLGELRARGGRGVEVLQGFGLSVAQLAAMSPDQAFLEVADAMAKLESATERAALAATLKLGPGMANVLMQGRQALEDNIAEAERLGIAFSRVEAEQVAQANDAWDRMAASVRGVTNEITIGLAPAIKSVADDLRFAMKDLARIGAPALQRMPPAVALRYKQYLHQGLITEGPPKVSLPDFISPEMGAKTGMGLPTPMELEAERAAERAQELLDRESQRLVESLRTPSEGLAAELSHLEFIFANTSLSAETFQRGLEGLQQRAQELAREPVASIRSTEAIRAGSIEALRAQFSGKNPELKAAEKTQENTAKMAEVLERINEKLVPLAEAPG